MRATGFLVLAVVAGCGGGDTPTAASRDSTPTPAVVRPQLSIIAGDQQQGRVGQVLPVQLEAALTDRTSRAPLPGRLVSWAVIQGGGEVFVPTTQTGSDGIARQRWTMGRTAGAQVLVARYIDPETGEAVTLDTARATALPDAPASLFFPGRRLVLEGIEARDTSLRRSDLPTDGSLLIEFEARDRFGNLTPCADRPGTWRWGIAVGLTVPNPPLITVRDTVVVSGQRRFMVLTVRASAQPADWNGSGVVDLRATGCGGEDRVRVRYDHLF